MGVAYQIRNQESLYFLTFQVVGWADIFTRQAYRDIIIESFKFCREKKDLMIFAYVIMSNHVHIIAKSNKSQLSDAVRDFKKFTSKQILNGISNNPRESRKEWLLMIFKYHAAFNKRSGQFQVWTHHNHAVELDSVQMIESRLNYIHNNPVKAGWVINAEDYLYSSARNYAGLDSIFEIDDIGT